MSIDAPPTLKAGLFSDVDEQSYHADRRTLSHSGAKLILEAPAKFRWEQDHPPEPKPEFDIGSAVHSLVLGAGPELIIHDYDRSKIKEPKRTTAWKVAQAEARATGNILLLPDEYQQVQEMADAVLRHPLAAELFADGEPEVTAYGQDPDTGVWLRGRFDWLAGSTIVDLKTSYDADPATFGTKAARLDYAMQDAWYRRLAGLAGHPVDGFVFVLVEKDEPYLVSVCVLDQDAVDWGSRRAARAIEIFRDCTESGIWPGYQPDGEFTVCSLPAWALREEFDE